MPFGAVGALQKDVPQKNYGKKIAKGNFLFSPFYPQVNAELNGRKSSDNFARTYMPFAKMTTSIVIPGKGRFFTMGLHGLDNSNPNIESIYEPIGGGNLLGYTYANNQRIPLYTEEIPSLVTAAKGPYSTKASQGKDYLENEYYMQRDVKKFPPPGITSVQIRRAGLAGALLQADVELVAHTLGQLQALQEYLIVPGLHLILEWGQIAHGDDQSFLNTVLDFTKQDDEFFLKELSRNEKNRRHIFERYTKHTNCRYDFMLGVVSNFSFSTNGTEYTIKIRVSSPGDLISSLANTETSLPPDNKDVYTTSIREYFQMFFENKLTADHADNSVFKDKHIFLLQTPPKNDADTNNDTNKTNIESSAGNMFAEYTRSYYITWAYFVNEIIHGMSGGGETIKSYLSDQNRIPTWYNYPQLEKLGSTATGWIAEPIPADDPHEGYVGCHPYLRSIDPSVMIIYNKMRQTVIDDINADDPTKEIYQYLNKCATNQDFTAASKNGTEAYKVFKNYGNFDVLNGQAGLLSRGVWINHNIIVEAFLSQETFHGAISQILRRMSAATGDFWNLQLHLNESSEKLITALPKVEMGSGTPTSPSGAIPGGSNFIVVDTKFIDTQRSADDLLANADNIYMFNKRLDSGDINSNDYKIKANASGGELLSFEADFTLPSILASSIAIQGIKGEGEPDSTGKIGISTPVQYGAPFQTALVDILKPFGNTGGTHGMTEQQAYSIGGSAAGRDTILNAQGVQGAGKKINEAATITIKNKNFKIPATIESVPLLQNTEIIGSVVTLSKDPALATKWKELLSEVVPPPGQEPIPVNVQNDLVLEFTKNLLDTNPSLATAFTDQLITKNYLLLPDDVRDPIQKSFGNNPVPVEIQAMTIDIYNTVQPAGDVTILTRALRDVANDAVTDPDQPTLPAIQFKNNLFSILTKQNKLSTKSLPIVKDIFSTNDQEITRQAITRQAAQQQLTELVERVKNYGTILYLFEPIPSYMSRLAYQHGLKVAKGEVGGDGSNLFAPAPTRLRIKISLPGISGLHIGDLFWVDRIQPNFYLDGVFTTIGLSESVTPDNGWITSIEGIFLFLGRFHFAPYFLGKQPKVDRITQTVSFNTNAD